MVVKVKTRVALGAMFLFLLLALVGGVSFYHFNKVIAASKNVLKANYESVQYGNEMLNALSRFEADSSEARQSFEANLRKQESNITEKGEASITGKLRNDFDFYLRNPDSSNVVLLLQNDISSILDLNLKAIREKSEMSQRAVEDARNMISIIIAFCFLAGLTFTINFPGLIAGPLVKLTQAIKAISEGNYSHRIHLDRKDEFGNLAEAFNDMAEQLDKYRHSNLAKIMFEKKRAETVINSLKDASIGMDAEGRILFVNKQAQQMLDIKESQIVGKYSHEICRINDLFRFLMESEGNLPFKVVINNRENFFIRENIEILGDDKIDGRVFILKNITSFKELDVAKTNFIATISHELKTPLASSDFSLKLLEDTRVGHLSPDQRELVRQLRDDNQRMLRILSELLNLTQLESGRIRLDLQEVDPGVPIRSSASAVASAAKEKSIRIDVQIEDHLPKVIADPDKIVWVLNNFLINAIKYSPANGEVLIVVRKEADGIIFKITDTGVGMEKKYIDRIFDRYFQIPGEPDKKGTGIGLAICKEFIDAMGGRIWAESQPGKGSTFAFELPVAKIASEA